MFCDEGLPFSLGFSILLIFALYLESVPVVMGLILMTCLNNMHMHAYTMPLVEEETKETNKHKLAIQQKYKCANFIYKSHDYTCLLEDGVFDEAGYKMLGSKVYCPMCFSVIKKTKPIV